MLRASVNIPGPIPSEQNFRVSLANPFGFSLPPRARDFGLVSGIAGLVFDELTPLSSGMRNPPIATTAMIITSTGINTTNKIHLVAFVPVLRRSMLTAEMIAAGRPRISSGTERALLQYEQRAVRFEPITSCS